MEGEREEEKNISACKCGKGGKGEQREEGGKEGEILTRTFSNMISYSWFVTSLPIFTKM